MTQTLRAQYTARMLKTLLKVLGGLVALVVLAIAGVIGNAVWQVGRAYRVEAPAIAAATDPDSLARGEVIFTSMCYACHADPATGAPSGRWMEDIPPFLGKFYPANITLHPETGIGKMTDAEIARMIRTGIKRDGRMGQIMPVFEKMSDADVAAVLGFMRTSPLLAPVDKKQPPNAPSLIPGKLILTYVVGGPRLDGARLGVTAPEKAATVEYGRYAMEEVYQCWDCHTEGFSPTKKDGPDALAGGFEFADPQGNRIWSPNITPSKTAGIGDWTLEEFARAVREGVSKDGSLVRYPMPTWRMIDDVEMAAMYAYLMGRAPNDKPNKPSALPRPKAPAPEEKPEEIFAKMGCVTCHADGAPYAAKLKQAHGKPVEEVAAWIRNPEKSKPGTQMPTFEHLLDEQQALSLAEWVQAKVAGTSAAAPATSAPAGH